MIPAVLPAPTTDHPSATRPDDPGAEAAFGDALRRAEQAVCPTGRGDGQPSCEPGDPTEDPGTAPADSTEAPCEPDGVDGEPTAEAPEEDAGRPDAPAGTAAVAITAAAQPAGDARVDPPAPVDGAGDLTGEAAETTVASTVDLPTSPDAPDTAADTVDVPVETTAEPTDLDAPLAAQAEDVTTGTAATAADDHAAEGSGHDAEVPAPAPTPDAGSDVDVRVETADRQVPMAAEDAAPTRSPAAPTTAQVSADAAPAADPGAHADAAMPTTAMPTTAPAPATTGTAAASTPAPATPAPLAQQLVEHVTPLAGGPDGTHELTIELRPASLGRVQLEVTLQDGVLHVLVQADDPGSRRLLAQSLTDLRAALTEAGVTAGQLDVGDPGSGDARANADTGTDGRSPGTRPHVGAGDGAPADIHPATPQTTSAASVGRGRPTIDVLL